MPVIRHEILSSQGTGYNLRTHTTGKLHVVIVDDQIRPILLHSASEISFSAGIWNVPYSEKPTDWSIHWSIFRYEQLILSQVSHGSGQAVFVMYRFDYISQTYF